MKERSEKLKKSRFGREILQKRTKRRARGVRCSIYIMPDLYDFDDLSVFMDVC